MEESLREPKRIVLSGGPGGGKTTFASFLKREFKDSVVIVPEAATMVYTSGFPRIPSPEVRKINQQVIYEVQRNLEKVQKVVNPEMNCIFDRGTIDGAAYWPGGPEDFFTAFESSFEQEADRYDAVIFFETAAAGSLSITSDNPVRSESLGEAVEIDRRLQEIWRQHKNYHFISHEPSFFEKLRKGLMCIREILANR